MPYIRARLVAALATGLFFLGMAGYAYAASGDLDVVVTGTGLGAIPDGTAACTDAGPPLDVLFAVAPVEGYRIVNVDVAVVLTHPWAGDITATLLDASGSHSHVLFGRVGALNSESCGDGSKLGADTISSYVFSDSATAPPAGGFWQAAAAAADGEFIPTGVYRTTNSGGTGATDPMPPTSLADDLAGMTSDAFAGTWKLRVVDSGVSQTGVVHSASLTLHLEAADRVFADGFEGGDDHGF